MEPPGLGALLLSNPDEQVTLGVADHGATTINLFFGLTDGSQDPCAATEDLSGTWAEPTLSAGPGTLPLSMMGGPAQVVGATLTLNVDGACGGLEAGLLTGQLDTRTLVGLREALDAADPDALCALGPNFGFACVDCADAEPLCIDLRIEDLAGQPAGFGFVERTEADIGSDPGCR